MTDKKLCIKTDGIQSDDRHTYYNHRYEPTSYEILDILFDALMLTPEDTLVDYGCGKGRLNFYVNSRFHCNTVGIELNAAYYQDALDNLNTYNGAFKHKIQFECIPAQNYIVSENENYFYFFNPFSIELFRKVIGNILTSLEDIPRKCRLILYYPDPEYTFYLQNNTIFQLEEAITIPLSKDVRECFCIYTNE